jgi:type VI secretion system protein VasD
MMPSGWQTWALWTIRIGCLLCLTACASGPKPTHVQIDLQVMENINPDMNGRPSPVVVRLYELNSLTAFNSADFFSLYDKDRQTLGNELLAVDELRLMPDETRKLERTLQPDTQYLGIIAAFRDLEHSKWRSSMAIAPHKTTQLVIELKENQISIATPPSD